MPVSSNMQDRWQDRPEHRDVIDHLVERGGVVRLLFVATITVLALGGLVVLLLVPGLLIPGK